MQSRGCFTVTESDEGRERCDRGVVFRGHIVEQSARSVQSRGGFRGRDWTGARGRCNREGGISRLRVGAESRWVRSRGTVFRGRDSDRSARSVQSRGGHFAVMGWSRVKSGAIAGDGVSRTRLGPEREVGAIAGSLSRMRAKRVRTPGLVFRGHGLEQSARAVRSRGAVFRGRSSQRLTSGGRARARKSALTPGFSAPGRRSVDARHAASLCLGVHCTVPSARTNTSPAI